MCVGGEGGGGRGGEVSEEEERPLPDFPGDRIHASLPGQ